MDNVKQQVVDHLKQANNVLVTVRNNPTADLLSACIGLALILDKLDKHVAAVFSGAVPSTIEFLKPEETIEQTADSLRDFIIALDKSKADKLRYKVEDKIVRIFITPYKTSLSQQDLEFSQGDFNVDAVVALGVHEQQELDQAVTTHGRILHDAAVISINNTANGNLGAINWQDTQASSVSEMVALLVKDLGKELLDEQIATALLTGVVAETNRFSNDKTSPRTMSLAGDLIAAGANQQLVATELGETEAPPAQKIASKNSQNNPSSTANGPAASDGTLEIDHQGNEQVAPPSMPLPDKPQLDTTTEDADNSPEPPHASGRDMLPMPDPAGASNIGAPSFSTSTAPFSEAYGDEGSVAEERAYLVDAPTLPGNTPPPSRSPVEPSTINPFVVPSTEPPAPLIARSVPPPTAPLPSAPPVPPLPSQLPTPVVPHPESEEKKTLEDIEEEVHSSHLSPITPTQDVDSARAEVLSALQQGPQPLEPLTALNSVPLSGELHPVAPPPDNPVVDSIQEVQVDPEGNIKPTAPSLPVNETAPNPESPANRPMDMPLPPISSIASVSPLPPIASQPPATAPPPPVPPPITPNFMNPDR